MQIIIIIDLSLLFSISLLLRLDDGRCWASLSSVVSRFVLARINWIPSEFSCWVCLKCVLGLTTSRVIGN